MKRLKSETKSLRRDALPMKPSSQIADRASGIDARRAAFERAAKNLKRHWRISVEDSEILEVVVRDILSGHDPRQLLGIKPVRGPRSGNQGFEKHVAYNFWRLRLYDKKRGKYAATKVSQEFGIKPLKVEKIARKHRYLMQRLVAEWAPADWDFLSTGTRISESGDITFFAELPPSDVIHKILSTPILAE